MDNIKGRHELKHIINYSDFLELSKRLPIIAKKDANTLSDNSYIVRSLYFDNYMDKALIEKIDGVNEREKFRIRLYNSNLDIIKLEKKAKKNGLCYKESTAISKEICQKLLEGDINILKESKNKLCFELFGKMNYEQLRPKNIVVYNRQAFTYPIGNVRITLDYNIRGSMNTYDFLKSNIVAIPTGNQFILEVKYDEFLPDLIRGAVALNNRSISAFSKYAITRMI